MRYCSRCLYPANHPLHLTFDDAGVCSGCRIHEEKDALDWEERFERLRNIVDGFRSPGGRRHDCIVPVSGARDSHFIVHVVKNKLGLNPLLVSYNKHYNTKRGIRNLAYLRTLFDCDFLMQTVSPETVKRITRATLRLMGSMYWHCLAGETAYPVQVAVRLKIPLIIWGAHQGLDQVGMFSHLDEVEMTRKYRKEHDLMGFEAEDVLAAAPEIAERDMLHFVYPHERQLASVGVRGIYLGNYIRWDSKAQHEAMIDAYGYETAAQARTFDTYNDVDSFHYSGVHDFIKYIKHGYGKVTDHAVRELRFGRLTREQGIELVRMHRDMAPPADLRLLLDWLGMPEDEFLETVDRFRDPRIWTREDGSWRLLDSVDRHTDDPGTRQARLDATGDCRFRITDGRDPEAVEDNYVLIGRGWVDDRQDIPGPGRGEGNG
ncbi:N-acetyl sugar amidotransferase [Nitratidesulfovibrio sp. HK-II]|jgi:N-acetyl sugar amidotransferase|uniref:N-acetyl sugar amidotransferase n=1 Tax=Nitratidesulfovibrio sp. HK-II TaxID=2009266 RepID=UPI000E2F1BCD|nr:N-acetyl sugar amidotransferase [Nitratidesulfovibrio sp. HK-II]GBO97672.1 legionaminic acid biosynthesis protein PtmG [Nitratidesulfovibrio sp. HK-II]